jgi:hypothetical protein
MNRVRITALAALALAPIGLAACSSNSNGTGNGGGAKPPGGASQSAGQHTSAAAGHTGDGGAHAGDVSHFCKLVSWNSEFFKDMTAGDERPGGIDVPKFKHDLQTIVNQAPPEIKPDMQALLTFWNGVLAGNADAQEPASLQRAMEHYGSWTAAHCAGQVGLPTGLPS